jgi:hypothetical protein
MGFTVSNVFNSVFGDRRVSVEQVTADAAEGRVTTRLSKIEFAIVSPRKQASFVASGNTSQTYVNYAINAGSTGTAINGTIGFSGCVANNIYFVVSFGV